MGLDPLALFAANYLYLVQLLVALVWFLRQPRVRQAQIFAFGVVFFPLVVLVAEGVGLLYYDPRPFVVGHFTPLIAHSADNGFPSDHSLLTSAVATLVAYFHLPLGLLLWALAAAVGAARVYAGIHHPIDVLGAFAFSLALSPLARFIARRWVEPPILGWLRQRR